MNDLQFDLERFVQAQESIFPQVLKELKAGRKRSPGCGSSFRSGRASDIHRPRNFTVFNRLKKRVPIWATSFLDRALPFARKRCSTIPTNPSIKCWGQPTKFRSWMTPSRTRPLNPLSSIGALYQFCGGHMDRRTLDLLGAESSS